MHPELLNNSLFLRYYKQWQDDPGSIVFAPISQYFLMYGMIDAAFSVCREGVKRHPELISGRLVMARIHLARGNWEEAEAELRAVLSVRADNGTAISMMDEIAAMRRAEREDGRAQPRVAQVEPGDLIAGRPSWNTVTMAGILAAQGHRDEAREIYRSILTSDPANKAALAGMEALGHAG
ncbi:MAG: tetratricopeptide repeat protein [Proteobacteria bacterium]|nr:tetratricopeptide repeat protein [Pseudomonadota bacterium]